MAHQWDARQVLDFDTTNSFTCVGITQKGRRCRNPIAYSNQQAASDTLDILSSHDPLSQDTRGELDDLAYFSLCVRYHRMEATTPGHSQHRAVVGGWKQAIRDHVAERAEVERRRAARRARRNREITAGQDVMSEAAALGRTYRMVPEVEASESSHRAILNSVTPSRRVRAQPSTNRLITANIPQTQPPSAVRMRRNVFGVPSEETPFSECSTAVGSPVTPSSSSQRASRSFNDNTNLATLLTPPPSSERQSRSVGEGTNPEPPLSPPPPSERPSRSSNGNTIPAAFLTPPPSSERQYRSFSEGTNPEPSLSPQSPSERSSRSFNENTSPVALPTPPPSSERQSRSFNENKNPVALSTPPPSSKRQSRSFGDDTNSEPSLSPPSPSERPFRSFNEDTNPGSSSSENFKEIGLEGKSLPLQIDGFEREIEDEDEVSGRAEDHLVAIFDQTETQDKGKGKEIRNDLWTSNPDVPRHIFEASGLSTKPSSSEATHMEHLIALPLAMMSAPFEASNKAFGRRNLDKIEDPFRSLWTGPVTSNPSESQFSQNENIQPKRTPVTNVLNDSKFMANKPLVEADNVVGSTSIFLAPHRYPVPCPSSPTIVQIRRDTKNQLPSGPTNGKDDNKPIRASSITTHDALSPPQVSIECLEVSSISTDPSLARMQPESSCPESNAISYVNITSTTKHGTWRLSELQQRLAARPAEAPPATEMVEHLSIDRGFQASLLLDMPKFEVRDTIVEIEVEDGDNTMETTEKRRCRLWKKLSRIPKQVLCMRLRRKPIVADED